MGIRKDLGFLMPILMAQVTEINLGVLNCCASVISHVQPVFPQIVCLKMFGHFTPEENHLGKVKVSIRWQKPSNTSGSSNACLETMVTRSNST